MAKKKTKTPVASAALKRSIARRFNDALAGRAAKTKTTDKRTLRRLERYRKELKKGTKSGNAALTPLDVAMRVDELLGHGDTVTALRKLCKPRASDYDRDTMIALLKEMHSIYKYRPASYRFAGVDDETLLAAGIIDTLPKKRGPKKGSKKSTAKKAAKKLAPAKRRKSK